MGFIGEEIENTLDEKYALSKGFTYITGKPMDEVYYWAVDRERDMILVSRGGGGLEMPESYGLYLDGVIVDVEGRESREGSRYRNDLKIHRVIDKICAPKAWFECGCGVEKLKEIIREAFTAYACIGLKPEQVQEVVVEINVEPIQKCNRNGKLV